MSSNDRCALKNKNPKNTNSSNSANSASSRRPHSSIMKSFEAASQGYIELSTTSSSNHHNTTIYGLSNLFRHVDEGRYPFMNPTDPSAAPVTVVCTSRVEMYVLKNDHMLKLIDFLKGTDAIRRLYELWYVVGGKWVWMWVWMW